MVKIPKSTQGYSTPSLVNKATYNVNAPREAFLDKEALELGVKAQNQEALGKSVSGLLDTVSSGLFKLQDELNKTEAKDNYTKFYQEYNEWLNNAKFNDPKYRGLKGNELLSSDAVSNFNKLKNKYVDKLSTGGSRRYFEDKAGAFEASSFTSLSGFQAQRNFQIKSKVNENLLNTFKDELITSKYGDPTKSNEILKQVYDVAYEMTGQEDLSNQMTKDIRDNSLATVLNGYISDNDLTNAKELYSVYKDNMDPILSKELGSNIKALEMNIGSENIASSVLVNYGNNYESAVSYINETFSGEKNFTYRNKIRAAYEKQYSQREKSKRVKLNSDQVYNSVTVPDDFKSETAMSNLVSSGLLDERYIPKINKARELSKNNKLLTRDNLDIELYMQIIRDPSSLNLMENIENLSKKDYEMLSLLQQKALASSNTDEITFNDLSFGQLQSIYGSVFGKEYPEDDSRDAKAINNMKLLMINLKKYMGTGKYESLKNKSELVNNIKGDLFHAGLNKQLTGFDSPDSNRGLFGQSMNAIQMQNFKDTVGEYPGDMAEAIGVGITKEQVIAEYNELMSMGLTAFEIKQFFYDRMAKGE